MASSSSSSSSSSSHNIQPHHLLPHYASPTSAPPPTPSTHPTSSTTAAAADTLRHLLHRLPPTLSFPPRRLSPPPLPTSLTSSSLQLGYFQLSPNDHHISPQLANSAESQATSLFNSPTMQKTTLFPTNDWPLGFDDNDDDDDDYTTSFCLDGRVSATELASLTELTGELEKVGLNLVKKLACMLGFDNSFGENGSGSGVGPSSLMWVSLLEAEKRGRVYPYVVGLQYQIRAGKWKLASDVGSVEVEPEVGSILVTFGDIAQVWSNGKLNKIRGRPTGVSEDRARSGSNGISMTMLLTLPLESTVSPLLSVPTKMEEKDALEPVKDCKQGNDDNQEDDEDWRVFNSFSFEDYAWRVYHERLHLKDPLDRYRRLRD